VLIKQLYIKKHKINCTKLLKPQNDHATPDSYVVVETHGRTERNVSDVVSQYSQNVCVDQEGFVLLYT